MIEESVNQKNYYYGENATVINIIKHAFSLIPSIAFSLNSFFHSFADSFFPVFEALEN